MWAIQDHQLDATAAEHYLAAGRESVSTSAPKHQRRRPGPWTYSNARDTFGHAGALEMISTTYSLAAAAAGMRQGRWFHVSFANPTVNNAPRR